MQIVPVIEQAILHYLAPTPCLPSSLEADTLHAISPKPEVSSGIAVHMARMDLSVRNVLPLSAPSLFPPFTYHAWYHSRQARGHLLLHSYTPAFLLPLG